MPSTTIFSSKKSQMIELLLFTSDRSWKQDYNRQTERIFTCNSYFVVLLHLMSIFVHRKKFAMKSIPLLPATSLLLTWLITWTDNYGVLATQG